MARMCGRAGDQPAVRKGPWTLEEDLILVSYISEHGEGAWDKLARAAGLHRNGKSCRLRWLNYLRPGVRRGSITLEEDAVIRELHARLGNRWSKISEHLPGRTDNEIKNYWRTRIQTKKPTTSAQQQQSNRAPTTTVATATASEGASWSPSPASHGQGSSSSDAGGGEWCMQAMQPSRDQQAYNYCYYQNAMAANGASGSWATTSASQASSAAGDCGWYFHPKPDQESYCSQNAAMASTAVALDSEGASSSSLASQDCFSAATRDGYMQQTSHPYYYSESELGSVVDHVKTVSADTLTTTRQFFSSDITDSFWDVVDNFWE